MKKPLVSLCIACYNQERYIADAISSALNQTYDKLEIVICDDCSSDNTFSVVDSIISNYRGSHSIVCVQNDARVGIIKNYEKCFRLSRGELIVTGAGDDVSYSNRIEEIACGWLAEREKPTVILHGAELIDTHGHTVGSRGTPLLDRPIGALMAYDRRVVDLFPKVEEPEAFEDDVFTKRALLLGDALRIEMPLMKYRVGSGVSTSDDYAERRIRVASRCLAAARQIQSDMRVAGKFVDARRLEDQKRKLAKFIGFYRAEIETFKATSFIGKFDANVKYLYYGGFGLKRWVVSLIRFVLGNLRSKRA